MQYILSQTEYDELKNTQKQKSISEKNELQKVCTNVANTMPVFWGWGVPDNKPWGCIVNRPDWYCDKCPVQTICPKEWKNFSQ